MGSILVVEVRRFLARRLVRLVGLLVLGGILLAGVLAFVNSHRLTDQQQAEAEASRRNYVASCAGGDFGIPPEEIPSGQTLEQYCEETAPPAVEFASSQPFRITSLQDIYIGTSVLAMLIAWLVAGSFVGAEWHAGTMGTLLTWEPRRIRVIVAKAGVAVVLLFVATVVVQAILGLALLPAAALRGSTAGADVAWFRDTAGVVVRGATAAAIGAGIGFAVASIARNTAAALGVGFGYLVVLENIMAALRPGWQKWLLVPNLGVFLTGSSDEVSIGRSPTASGLLLGSYALVLLVAATGLFRARDVR